MDNPCPLSSAVSIKYVPVPFPFSQNHMHRSEMTSLGSRMTSSRFRTGSKRSAACASVDHLFRSVTSDMMSWLTTKRITDRWKRSSRDRSVATWHTKHRMVGGTRVLFREASSTEASSSLGSGQITKGLTESQRPVPDIMSQRRSPRVKRNAAVTSLFNVVRGKGLQIARPFVYPLDHPLR